MGCTCSGRSGVANQFGRASIIRDDSYLAARCVSSLRKRLIAAVLLAAVSPIAAAGAQSPWQLLVNQTIVLKKTCIGAAGIAETADGVSAWIKDTYASTRRLPGGKEFTIAKGEMLIDCAASKWKMIRAVAYSAAGDAVFDDSRATAQFQPVVKGSVAADFTKAACGMARAKRQWAMATP